MWQIIILVIISLALLGAIVVMIYLMPIAFCWIVSGVPFVDSEKKVIEKIKKEVRFKSDSILLDLGCGSGKAIYSLAKENPQTKFIGYELNPILVLLAKIKRYLPNVSYHCKNFFKADISKADYIFVFLFPELMDKLLPKFQKELKSGTLVITNSFCFRNGPEPIKKIESEKSLESLYIYQF